MSSLGLLWLSFTQFSIHPRLFRFHLAIQLHHDNLVTYGFSPNMLCSPLLVSLTSKLVDDRRQLMPLHSYDLPKVELLNALMGALYHRIRFLFLQLLFYLQQLNYLVSYLVQTSHSLIHGFHLRVQCQKSYSSVFECIRL